MTERIIKQPRVLALGMFDGVHAGHRALIREACRLAVELGAEPAVYTFSTHPAELFGKRTELLTTAGERDALLLAAGAKQVFADPFDRALADMEPVRFVEMLVERFGAVGLVAGFNYTFGRGARGTAETLKTLADARSLTVSVVPPVTRGEQVVSSARIRELIREEGNVSLAGELLLRPYSLSGTVVRGFGNGHKLDFPTANLDPDAYAGLVLPLTGVYATETTVDGRTLPAVTNVGKNPTFGADRVTVETHVIGLDEDLYGKRITVSFAKRLRGEFAFASMDELRAQIARDIAAARGEDPAGA